MCTKFITRIFFVLVSIVFSSSFGLAASPIYPEVIIVGENHTEQVTAIAHIEMLHRAGQGELRFLIEGVDTSLNSQPGVVAKLARRKWGIPADFKIANVLGIDSTFQELYDVLATHLIAQDKDETLDPYLNEVLCQMLAGVYEFKMIPIVNDSRFMSVKNIFADPRVPAVNLLEAFNLVPAALRQTYLEAVYRQIEKSIAPSDRVTLEKLHFSQFKSAMEYFVSRIHIRDVIMARNIERYARNSSVPVVVMVGHAHVPGIIKYLKEHFGSLVDSTFVTSCDGLLTAFWK